MNYLLFTPLRRAVLCAPFAIGIGSLSLLTAFTMETGNLSEPSPTVAMVVQTGAAMNYWPNWRGPSLQGIVQGKGYPDKMV